MRWFKSKNQRAIEHWMELAETYRELASETRRDKLVQQCALYHATAQAYEICAKELQDGHFL